MADRFFNPISVPDLPNETEVTSADIGYLKLYAKNGLLYQKNSNNAEVQITNELGSVPLFIQDTQPDSDRKYLWIQTNYQTQDGFTFWFEDGVQ